MLPVDLQARINQRLESLRHEAQTHRQTRHLTWRRQLAEMLRQFAQRLEPEFRPVRNTLTPAR